MLSTEGTLFDMTTKLKRALADPVPLAPPSSYTVPFTFQRAVKIASSGSILSLSIGHTRHLIFKPRFLPLPLKTFHERL